jgi:hypothetical protein
MQRSIFSDKHYQIILESAYCSAFVKFQVLGESDMEWFIPCMQKACGKCGQPITEDTIRPNLGMSLNFSASTTVIYVSIISCQ